VLKDILILFIVGLCVCLVLGALYDGIEALIDLIRKTRK
jgi:hypothetical protein